MNKIKIADKKDQFLFIDLIDILEIIKDKVNNYNWAILELYCTSRFESDLKVPELEEQIELKEKLFVIDFKSLFTLSSKFLQVIDGKFVASKGIFPQDLVDSIKLVEDREVIEKNWEVVEKNFEVAVEIDDGSYWTVFSKDEMI